MAVTPSRYVTGEESALVRWLGGGDAKPTFGPPRPFERGVRGRPTLVDNVETLAHLALIARFGAEWYRGLGTPEDPGTALVTLTGDLPRPGLYELPFGLPFVEALRAAGGRALRPRPSSSVAIRAPGSRLRRRRGHHRRRVVGADRCQPGLRGHLGVGPTRCGLVEVARVTRWLAAQSAGQCGPCGHGLPAIAGAVEALVAGDRDCGAEGAAGPVARHGRRSGRLPPPRRRRPLRPQRRGRLRSDISAHRRRGPCPAQPPLLPTPDLDGSWR